MDPSDENPSGSFTTPSNLSETMRDITIHNEAKSDTGVLPSYMISSDGETTDLRELLRFDHTPKTPPGLVSKASDRYREGLDEKSEQDQSALGEDG